MWGKMFPDLDFHQVSYTEVEIVDLLLTGWLPSRPLILLLSNRFLLRRCDFRLFGFFVRRPLSFFKLPFYSIVSVLCCSFELCAILTLIFGPLGLTMYSPLPNQVHRLLVAYKPFIYLLLLYFFWNSCAFFGSFFFAFQRFGFNNGLHRFTDFCLRANLNFIFCCLLLLWALCLFWPFCFSAIPSFELSESFLGPSQVSGLFAWVWLWL